MYRYSKDGVSVLTVVDRRRKKKNGSYPVKIEVICRRRQRYYPTGQDVTPDEWESMWRQGRRSTPKQMSIENSFHLVRTEVERLADRGEFCFTSLDNRLGRTFTTVNSALRSKMDELMSSGQINSHYRCRSTLASIERFCGKDVPFEAVTVSWLHRWEDFMSREGKSVTTINIYMKTLRSICQEAVECGTMKQGQFPFGKGSYRIPAGKRRSLALTKEQISLIIRWQGDDDICYWRDMWLFSYLCNGINFRDMLFLKYGDVVDGEIRFVRAKTAKANTQIRLIRASITPLMYDIMERSGNGRSGDAGAFIFRHARGDESPMRQAMLVRHVVSLCNKALTVISESLGLPKFTTYSARHSFATVMQRSGADLHFISESLGHSSISVTENYLAAFGKEERRNYARLLTE